MGIFVKSQVSLFQISAQLFKLTICSLTKYFTFLSYVFFSFKQGAGNPSLQSHCKD